MGKTLSCSSPSLWALTTTPGRRNKDGFWSQSVQHWLTVFNVCWVQAQHLGQHEPKTQKGVVTEVTEVTEVTKGKRKLEREVNPTKSQLYTTSACSVREYTTRQSRLMLLSFSCKFDWLNVYSFTTTANKQNIGSLWKLAHVCFNISCSTVTRLRSFAVVNNKQLQFNSSLSTRADLCLISTSCCVITSIQYLQNIYYM